MNNKIIGTLSIAIILTGCQPNSVPLETTTNVSVEQIVSEPETLTQIDVYTSLDSLRLAFEITTSSNEQIMLSDEKVYYLTEDNDLGSSLKEILVREGYFNCTYNDGIMVITHRLSNGAEGLDVLTTNNPNTFSKRQVDGYEYYYVLDNTTHYYYLLQDSTFVQINVPKEIDVTLDEVLRNITFMPIHE
jgi:hypothetical protein